MRRKYDTNRQPLAVMIVQMRGIKGGYPSGGWAAAPATGVLAPHTLLPPLVLAPPFLR